MKKKNLVVTIKHIHDNGEEQHDSYKIAMPKKSFDKLTRSWRDCIELLIRGLSKGFDTTAPRSDVVIELHDNGGVNIY